MDNKYTNFSGDQILKVPLRKLLVNFIDRFFPQRDFTRRNLLRFFHGLCKIIKRDIVFHKRDMFCLEFISRCHKLKINKFLVKFTVFNWPKIEQAVKSLVRKKHTDE